VPANRRGTRFLLWGLRFVDDGGPHPSSSGGPRPTCAEGPRPTGGPRSGYDGGPRSSCTGGPSPTCAGGLRPRSAPGWGSALWLRWGSGFQFHWGSAPYLRRGSLPKTGFRVLAALGVHAQAPLPRPTCAGSSRHSMQAVARHCCRGSRRLPADKLSVGSTGCFGWSLPPSGSIASRGPPGCAACSHWRDDTAPFPWRSRAARTNLPDIPCATRRNVVGRTSGSPHS
jgi:hypothetical protein